MDRHAQPPSAIALPTEDPGGADEPQDVENPIYAPPDRLTTGRLLRLRGIVARSGDLTLTRAMEIISTAKAWT